MCFDEKRTAVQVKMLDEAVLMYVSCPILVYGNSLCVFRTWDLSSVPTTMLRRRRLISCNTTIIEFVSSFGKRMHQVNVNYIRSDERCPRWGVTCMLDDFRFAKFWCPPYTTIDELFNRKSTMDCFTHFSDSWTCSSSHAAVGWSQCQWMKSQSKIRYYCFEVQLWTIYG